MRYFGGMYGLRGRHSTLRLLSGRNEPKQQLIEGDNCQNSIKYHTINDVPSHSTINLGNTGHAAPDENFEANKAVRGAYRMYIT